MKPTEAEIRTAAYHRWERLGRKMGFAEEDWLESELDLTLKLNYEVLSALRLNVGEKCFTGDPDHRSCRYCRMTEPATTFKKEAHALPELMGNKVLIAWDECDRCNEFFSRHLEDHFSKFTLPFRAGLRISGKKGVPSYKTKDKASRMDFDRTENALTVLDRYDSRILTPDPDNQAFSLVFGAQPYVPVAVFKCLTKMGLAVMPPEELDSYRRAIEWILDPDHSRRINQPQNLGCYLWFAPSPIPVPSALLLRRTEPSAAVPYMLFLFANSHLMIEIYIPFCTKDQHLEGRLVSIPRYDMTIVPGQERLLCQVVPLNSAGYEREAKLTLRMTYDEERPIE